MVVDPYSVAGASTSSTNRQNTDTRRMNSIDNGLLLCVKHHIQFDANLFSIHPEVRAYTLFSHSCAQLTDPIDPYRHLFPSTHQVY